MAIRSSPRCPLNDAKSYNTTSLRSDVKIRRCPNLVCLWKGPLLEVSIPSSPIRYRISQRIFYLLSQLDTWTDVEALLADPNCSNERIQGHLQFLLKVGIVEDSTNENAEDTGPWQHWGPIAQYFHSVARDAHYPESPEERDQLAASIAESSPSPYIFKNYPDNAAILLPRALRSLDMSLSEAFIRRRTHRDFTNEPVDCETFSTILHYCFAPQRFANGMLFGTQQMRVSPSAGGRHEVECYVTPLNVIGIPPGLYHYDPQRHAIELLRETFSAEDVASIAYGQQALRTAAFVCFTTVVAERLAWKYRHPRAYRLWMYDAGHYGQTFALACTALSLGPFQTAAFMDTRLEQEIGLDPKTEFGAYVLAAGYPITSRNGEPASFSYPLPDRLV